MVHDCSGRCQPVSPRPYRLGQRQAASDRTRARIIDAARELLASDRGFAGFSLEAVARQADVARVTVYNQFKSKVGLLEAVFDELARRGGMERLPAAFSVADPLHAIDAYIAVFCGFWASDRVAIKRVRAAAALDPDLERALGARDERRGRGLTVLLSRLSATRGTPAPDAVDAAVDVLVALTSFETFDQLARTRGRESVEALLRHTARAVLGVAG